MTRQEFTVRVHHEDGTLWAEVIELPGVFATGDNMDELTESLTEALNLVLGVPTHTEWETVDPDIENRRLVVCA